MCYSALEHLFCVMTGSSKFTGIVGAKQMIVPLNKALSVKEFRNKSRFTKRRELYRMLPIYEKANRIHGVI